MNVDLIAGARPNFMKIAPIIDAIKADDDQVIKFRLVHTGQHYDYKMSGSFFEELGIPHPDVNLEVGSGTQAEQTAKIMQGYEALLLKESTDLCLVVGDVTSTMACAIAAKKMNVKVAHVEGGIRSRDLSMPEEINRLVTDAISDYFFTTSDIANTNLANEGHGPQKIHFVGNTMIDSLLKHMPRFTKPVFFDELKLENGKYFVMTMHRPANVDQPEVLRCFFDKITEGADGIPVVFPIHPRTRKTAEQSGISFEGLHLVDPMPYLEFNYLVQNAMGVITDSGGITEETTVMSVPCLTLRDNTERPETCIIGTNELIGTNPSAIPAAMKKIRSGKWKKGSIPAFWDGKAASRIVEILKRL